MAVLTALPPTPGSTTGSLPFTPDIPPHMTSIRSHSSPTANQVYGELLDLDFADDDSAPTVSPPYSQALTKYSQGQSWVPILPDGPKGQGAVKATGGGADDTEGDENACISANPASDGEGPNPLITGGMMPNQVDENEVGAAGEAAIQEAVKVEEAGEQGEPGSETPATAVEIPKTPKRQASSLSVAARPFDASAIRSPSAIYTSESENSGLAISNPTSPAASSVSLRDTYSDTAEWAMQQGFGGFGTVPLPTAATPAPLPSRTYMPYHTMPTSTPVRITSPETKKAHSAPRHRVDPVESPSPATPSPTLDDSSTHLSEPSDVERPETPLSNLTRTLSTFSLNKTPTTKGPARDAKQLSNEPWAQGLAELAAFKDVWKELREAFARFGGGVEEVAVRLQDTMSRSVQIFL